MDEMDRMWAKIWNNTVCYRCCCCGGTWALSYVQARQCKFDLRYLIPVPSIISGFVSKSTLGILKVHKYVHTTSCPGWLKWEGIPMDFSPTFSSLYRHLGLTAVLLCKNERVKRPTNSHLIRITRSDSKRIQTLAANKIEIMNLKWDEVCVFASLFLCKPNSHEKTTTKSKMRQQQLLQIIGYEL